MADDKKSIETRVLPGFMELLPAEQIAFDKIKNTIQKVYESFGFVPLDTPAIERAGVLITQSGNETEKQIYHFKKGDTDLALRFDLTVPLARYVAEHEREITFPFRRYHIAKVYRGETPQKGRYREFYQCDIDIIGNETLSLFNDAEIISVIYSVFKKLNFGPFVVRVNNRKLISGLLESLNIEHLSTMVMREIDKIEKVGEDAVREALLKGIPSEGVEKILTILQLQGNEEVFDELEKLDIKNDTFIQGLNELKEVVSWLDELNVPRTAYEIDLTIARGLDYYTGTVYETKLINHPQIGSVCSGGRYDNLAERFISRKLPGVGVSIGLTRLFSQLKDAGLVEINSATTTKVLVVPLMDDMTAPLQIATELRSNGIATEIYFEDDAMKKKLGYANKLQIPFTIMIGENEIASGLYAVKDMTTGEQTELPIDEITSFIAEKL